MVVASTSARNIDSEVLKGARGWFLALGILLIILGIAALSVPIAVSVTMAVFLGIILLIAGAAQLIHAIAALRWSGFFLHLLGAVVYIIFAIALLVNPERGVRALTLLLAAYFLATGFIKILMAVISHGAANWGWLLFGGIVNFVLGVLIWSQWPDNADWIIGLFVGIDLFLSGWALIMLALAAKSVPPPRAAAS